LADLPVGVNGGRKIGFGERPAIVNVDFQPAFTDPQYPTGVFMEDIVHVAAGRDQKKRFYGILLPFLALHGAALRASAYVAPTRPAAPRGDLQPPSSRWLSANSLGNRQKLIRNST
jgi:hypothetical protein